MAGTFAKAETADGPMWVGRLVSVVGDLVCTGIDAAAAASELGGGDVSRLGGEIVLRDGRRIRFITTSVYDGSVAVRVGPVNQELLAGGRVEIRPGAVASKPPIGGESGT